MNTFGRHFRVTTFGESHGPSIGCVIDGCPSNLPLCENDIQADLDRRKPGTGSITTPRAEKDIVRILSGVFEGRTTGTPIGLLIENRDVDSSKYLPIKDKPRPSHADFTYYKKFGRIDWRGGGRASARETAMRVAAGAVAKKILKTRGIEILAHTLSIGNIKSGINYYDNYENFQDISKINNFKKISLENAVHTLDIEKAQDMESAILYAKSQGDSIGGIIEVIAYGVPAGIGEPVFNKLDAEIASAMMGIPAVKGVEIGGGFELSKTMGSESNDEFFIKEVENDRGEKEMEIITKTNNCGGILGGITNGMPIVARVAVKPTASISKKQGTVDLKSRKNTAISIEGRHDPCIVPRAQVVVEAMTALTIIDHCMMQGVIGRVLD